MFRRLMFIFTMGSLLGIAVTGFNPVHSTFLKLGLIGCVGGSWAGLLVLLWKRSVIRIGLILVPLACAIPLSLPGREMDAAELGGSFVRRMSSYEGVRYFWGGESSRGIDCSGLPRRALRDALLCYGIRHGNGRAFRAWAEQWWFDASAKALGKGYRDYTTALGISGTIHDLDYRPLVAGDLAVTRDGVHILAYAGEGRWIQADPGIGEVATLDGRTDGNRWFTVPVTLHRWKLLDLPETMAKRAGSGGGEPPEVR